MSQVPARLLTELRSLGVVVWPDGDQIRLLLRKPPQTLQALLDSTAVFPLVRQSRPWTQG